MAVIIKYNEEGSPIISSYGKVATNQEQENAVELDKQLKSAIPKIEPDLVKESLLPKTGNAKPGIANETWWELGKRIAAEIDNNDLMKSSDWKLIWEAIELYCSERIKKADRGKNRKHVHICYRYSKFPKNKALKIKWAEWADYFGKPVLSKDPRADIWIKKNIDRVTLLKRDEFRGMTKYFVEQVCKRGKIELSAKSDEKFYELWDNGFQKYLENIKENGKRD
jgi:hypothetical protein